MMPADVAWAAFMYYLIGLVWLAIGAFLPLPMGWLKHNMPAPFAVFFVIVAAAIWPLILGKIVSGALRGEEDVEL